MPRRAKKSPQANDDPENEVGREIESISQEESLRRHREFLRQLEKLLADLTANPGTAIPGRHHENMSAAWNDVRPNFSLSIQALQRPAVNNIITQLEDSGLMGNQLVFKLSIFQHAYDELLDHGPLKDAEPTNRPWWKRLRDLFKPTLKAANVILGSLATFIPPLEPIKEYKESVESGFELGQAVAESIVS
jgi:hypothetical protein